MGAETTLLSRVPVRGVLVAVLQLAAPVNHVNHLGGSMGGAKPRRLSDLSETAAPGATIMLADLGLHIDHTFPLVRQAVQRTTSDLPKAANLCEHNHSNILDPRLEAKDRHALEKVPIPGSSIVTLSSAKTIQSHAIG